METHLRSILKAVSWRLMGSLVTFLIVLAVTRKLQLAAGAGFLDTIIKIGAFYFHERLWHRINYGKLDPPDYQI